MAEIGIIDNDVLVNFFGSALPKRIQSEIIFWLQNRFSQVWIPAFISKKEFSITPSRKKILNKLLLKYSGFFRECPISVSANERKLHFSIIDEGEADGILQSYKAPRYPSYNNLMFRFISRDNCALNYATSIGVGILDYDEIRTLFMEKGIILP